jgi:hypothetical protein
MRITLFLFSNFEKPITSTLLSDFDKPLGDGPKDGNEAHRGSKQIHLVTEVAS